jgi:hypothetical protein
VRFINASWGAGIDVLHSWGRLTSNWIYFDIRSPSGSYTTGGRTDFGISFGEVGGRYTDEELMRSALFSGGQIPATFVDVRYYTSGPRWWYPQPSYGEVKTYYNVFSPIAAWGYIDLDFEYKLPPVPEPSSGVLVILGAALMALRRKRTVH